MCMFLPLVYTDVKPGKWRQDEDVCAGVVAGFQVQSAAFFEFWGIVLEMVV